MEEGIDYHEILLSEYCPPLDEPLFLAVASEYNLDLPEQRRDVVGILSQLKKSALAEEHSDFDPAGTGGFSEATEDHDSALSRSTLGDESTSNGTTSITTSSSGIHVDGAPSISADLENLSHEDKVNWLRETFPNIVPFETSNTLRRCDGNLNRTVDNLLNLSFLPKGVDGFGQNEYTSPAKHGRSRRRDRTTESSGATSAASQHTGSSPESASNIWASVAEDVDFICARTTLDGKSVKSVWHANGTSLPATIRALAVKQAAILPDLQAADMMVQIRVIDLKQDFDNVPEAHLFAILDLARNIPSAARELVEMMISVLPAETVPLGKVSGYAQYAPVKLDSDTENHLTPTKWTAGSASIMDGHSSHVADHGIAASNAFRQAGSAYKRGKSDRLMGGAAAYYAQIGHEHMRLAKQQTAVEANQRVATQSSSYHTDLHGVSVADAVRIARVRTEYWWEGLGDAKYCSGGNNAAATGLRIITGVGKHSKDGALRIGPAVSKMLIREGWKTEVLAGEIIVRGRAKC